MLIKGIFCLFFGVLPVWWFRVCGSFHCLLYRCFGHSFTKGIYKCPTSILNDWPHVPDHKVACSVKLRPPLAYADECVMMRWGDSASRVKAVGNQVAGYLSNRVGKTGIKAAACLICVIVFWWASSYLRKRKRNWYKPSIAPSTTTTRASGRRSHRRARIWDWREVITIAGGIPCRRISTRPEWPSCHRLKAGHRSGTVRRYPLLSDNV